MIDPRLTPARGDVAAAHLKGQVEAKSFVEGAAHQVLDGVCALRETPFLSARLETQLLHGEIFTVYDVRDGWAFGQCALDDYVGYAETRALSAEVAAPTLRVVSTQAIIFPQPSAKAQPHFCVGFNAKLKHLGDVQDGFIPVRGGWIAAAQVAPLDYRVTDWVSRAEFFLGAPYLWGGKQASGLDCSGLIQLALEAAGVRCPRDSDMQEAALGDSLELSASLQRGDLIFWDGHVGVMCDAALMLHANGHHMKTVLEPLSETIKRTGAPRSVKRL